MRAISCAALIGTFAFAFAAASSLKFMPLMIACGIALVVMTTTEKE